MTELEKLEYTKSFIDKLANGINPLDDTPIPEGDLLNNVRLSRCMFYVSDILRQVIENGGTQKQKKAPKLHFSITLEQLSKYAFSEYPISVSEIAKKLYSLAENESMDKLTYKDITAWLLQVGMLCERPNSNNKMKKYPTVEGHQLGISYENRQGSQGEYEVVVYNKEAQQFILDNIEAVIALKYNS